MAATAANDQRVQTRCTKKCIEPNSTDPFFYNMALVVPVAITWPLWPWLGVATAWPQRGL
eukprot:11182106-Lingulodinium_polyedra.AAC.1